MKKIVVLAFVLVLSLSLIGVVSADKLKNWSAAYTYDIQGGTLNSPDFVPYSFGFNWTYPEIGESHDGGGAFFVNDNAEIYPGYVVFRGEFGVYAKPNIANGRECVRLPEPVTIHPDQPVRFHIGWGTDYPMSPVDAKAHFNSMVTTVDLGDGPIEMEGHEVTPSGNGNHWTNNICSFTVRN